MRFSRKTDYGFILVEALKPSFESRDFISLSAVSFAHGLPQAFLGKLAEALRRSGYVEAKRGKVGGYRLLRDPKTITLKELIDVFEEPKMMRCMKSSHPEKHCLLAGVCPTRKAWHDIEARVNKIFEEITVSAI